MKRFLTIAFSLLMFFGFASFISVDTYAADTWNHDGISVDKVSPQAENTSIKVSAKVSGPNTAGLQYKFVWMRDNWNPGNWGVIRNFNTTNNTTWKPTAAGNYTLYLDIKDAKGRIVTKTLNYRVTTGWNHDGISVDKVSPQAENTSIKVSAKVSGPNTAGLQYKFVWMKDNWKNWGVIRNFNTTNNTTWKPTTAGNYTLYLDIKDTKGRIVTKTLNYKINNSIWSNNGITLNIGDIQKLGATFKLTANTSGNTSGLQYKFVWMKGNWNPGNWGVIRDFNPTNNTTWKPTTTGSYTLYLDIKDAKGRKVTKTKSVRIDPASGIYGIDVSEWQGDINWQSVKNSGVKFAMLRSGWGYYDASGKNGKTDSKFYQNVKGAKAVGMPIGVYHFSYATSVWEAEKEAEYCLSIIRSSGVKFEYPIVFDIESNKFTDRVKGNKRLMTDIVKAFCNKIEKAGYYAAFYTNPDWLNNYLYANELTSRYDLWLAHYSGASKPSRNCGMWQYTEKGKIPGITANTVDLNYAYKDYPSMMIAAHLNGY